MIRHGWIAMSLALAGCAGSPSSNYYTLSAANPCPAKSPVAAMARAEQTIVRLPGVLDRPQLVVRTDPQTVQIHEFDRWAEPLDQMASRILVEDMAKCESPPRPNGPEYVLSVSVDEFMADISGRAVLTGRWWIARKGEKVSQPARQFALVEKADGTSGAQSAAAMSALLGKLAGEIVFGLSHAGDKNSPAAS